jgi:signal transduction histidine kinase
MADPTAHRERIGQAIDEIDATIKEIRTSIFLLSTPPAHGVRQEVTSIVDGYAEREGWLARVGFDGPVDSAIPDAFVHHVEAVIREAVSNIARHANAHRVDVTVDVGADVVVVVADDGEGIPDEQTRRSGLANLERRATELGGHFRVESGPEGTTLTWAVPLPA